MSAVQTGAATLAGDQDQRRPVLELKNIHVRHSIKGLSLFGKETVFALTGANLSVSAGETVGIVGESGCGKSTLAKAIVGLQKPSDGEIYFNGASLWDMSADRRRTEFGRNVGMIFQDPSTALNRRLAIRRILRDPLDVHGIGDGASRDRRVRELMNLVGLPESAADALPTQLSGGQRQRVAIGRALALGPSLLVADEPTSALDVSVRAQILNLLLKLQKEMNLAMIFISHDIQTVRRMSDRIATMYLGRIVEEVPSALTPEGVAHPYTKALLSATPSILDEINPISLEGPVPSAVRPPSGCPFRTRCWKASSECAQEMPPVSVLSQEPLHTLRCFHPVNSGDASAPTPSI
ncbi:peptide ABC transporter ATP-binding protein [Arthrobacter alpinus]|uniref:Peptide ABC transporter ATP-binding protein n=1 Tax=Arthrobacter alpinus TaxID=656366 RepID=A0A0M4RM66_9MICC|nr:MULTISPECIES: ABC transporter ATP-binding protein [Arthrobacter]ALE91201.1 peptide ABC transporter ATP-binding protein [Arthrobacter alpinus]